MKKINIIYWTCTGLFVALMLVSAITSIMNLPETQVMVSKHLGYPPYFNPALGVAKLLGVIILLFPGYYRIKEWAYAGFTFDLLFALYSLISVKDPVKGYAMFPVIFLILAGSYIYYHKRKAAAGATDVAV
jgi:uncharacterized membrane protein YphA (DoxX/SURF4 family)